MAIFNVLNTALFLPLLVKSIFVNNIKYSVFSEKSYCFNYVSTKNKRSYIFQCNSLIISRGSGIRTHDPLLPKHKLTYFFVSR